MKINLNEIDTEQFMVHPHVVYGQTLFLVQPQHIGAKFTQGNKHFRSSVWDADGNLVSAAFPKFPNWGENPDNFPVPKSLEDAHVVEKVDGSLLIVSRWDGRIMQRTRGTVDATKLNNGHELELFNQQYRGAIDWLLTPFVTPNGLSTYSLLFEWVSPNQRIILNYGDSPAWYLVGCVYHDDYSLKTQPQLDEMANQYGFNRPPSYTFPSLADLMSGVEAWKGKEGVVIYSDNDQMLHKVKAFDYLIKHRFKSEATLENTLELYFSNERPPYQEFERRLIESFDYECFEMVRGYASSICDAAKDVQRIVEGIDEFVEGTLRPLPTRRAQAEKVLASYGQTNRSAFVFARLDNKVLNDDQMKKLYWQVLKK
jgi:hypothetical protein